MKKISLKKIISTILLCAMSTSIISGCSLNNKTQNTIVKEVHDIENAPLEVNIMNVGKADCILIEIEDKTIMIDAGLNKSGEEIVNTLKEKNIDTLEYLILTHMDKDHIGGADTVIDNIKINNLVTADYVKDSKQYTKYIEAAEKNKLSPVLLHENINVNINGAEINIYPAKKDYYEQSNDYSIIVDVTYGEYSFLFAGDAENERLREFLNSNNKKYTVVKMPHHGKFEDLSEQFIKQTLPSYSVITCSDEELPEDSLISLLENYNSKVFLTKDGGVTFKTDGTQISYSVNK